MGVPSHSRPFSSMLFTCQCDTDNEFGNFPCKLRGENEWPCRVPRMQCSVALCCCAQWCCGRWTRRDRKAELIMLSDLGSPLAWWASALCSSRVVATHSLVCHNLTPEVLHDCMIFGSPNDALHLQSVEWYH
jgi:hypothetical protein